jgi:uroporphyrinogen-III synthase
MRLLVTRPQPAAERTAAALRALGHAPVVAPVLRVEPIRARIPPGPWDGLAMTSANAACAMASHPRLGELVDLPLFAVGRRTAAAAREVGFTKVRLGDGDVKALEAVLREAVEGRVLYLAGEDRAGDLGVAPLSDALTVETVVIYRAAALDALPHEALAALAGGEIDAILHYSARSASVFVDLAKKVDVWPAACKAAQLCLSAQVAKPLIAAGAFTVQTATTPDEAALFALIRQTGSNQ